MDTSLKKTFKLFNIAFNLVLSQSSLKNSQFSVYPAVTLIHILLTLLKYA